MKKHLIIISVLVGLIIGGGGTYIITENIIGSIMGTIIVSIIDYIFIHFLDKSKNQNKITNKTSIGNIKGNSNIVKQTSNTTINQNIDE